VLSKVPTDVPVTSTERVQLAPPAGVPPVRSTEGAPATAVNVPPQKFELLGGVATTNPPGKLSVKAREYSGLAALGLSITKVSVVDPSSAITVSAKDFEIVGAGGPRALHLPR